MRLRTLVLALAVSLTPAAAQTTEELKALMQKITVAWCTLDPAKAACFCMTEGKHVFYDVAPPICTGWKEYADGTGKMFATLSAMKITLASDVQTHVRGSVAWGTATCKAELTLKSGRAETLDTRWTVIWEKRGNDWLVTHEHFSAPAPPDK